MKIKLLFLLAFIINFSNAQVGIGTTNPDVSSILDVKSSNSGLLIPRVSLSSTTDNTTIPNPANSLLVFNSNTQSDVTPGYYYWNTKWLRLATDDTHWKLDGNTLANGNEFLGSKNYFPLLLKTNNTLIGKFHPNGGINLGLNATAHPDGSVAIGQNAAASVNNSALALGYSAVASGFRASAIGYRANASNNDAVALGYNTNTSGIYGVAIGFEARTTGQSAFALGYQTNASGYLSSAIGNNSSATGAWSTAIGFGATSTQDNSIILGSSSNNNNKIGIGTNSPDERLHVVGSVKIVDGSQGSGKVLVSDATGKTVWQNPNSLKIYGEINKTTNQVLTSGGSIAYGNNGEFQNVTLGTNTIQVTQAGIYKVTYNIALYKFAGGTKINPEFYMQIWGTPVVNSKTYATLNNGDTVTLTYTKLVSLNAYDAIGVSTTLSDSNTQILANGTSLYIELVK
jgi:hypothetical protein